MDDKMEDGDDISLVFITTHGFPLANPDGSPYDIFPKDEDDGSDEGLVSYWGFVYNNLFIWDDQLNFLLNRLESEGVCLIVDSCYAGGFNDPPNWNMTDKNELQTFDEKKDEDTLKWIEGFGEDVKAQGRVVLMASREDEVSYSGGFTPYLIDGLRGFSDTNDDGIITAEEAFYYTEPRTYRQHPTMFDGYDGELPIVEINQVFQDSEEQNQIINSNKIGSFKESSDENSIIHGYITDINTEDPIENAYVYVRGRDNEWDFYENETTTDEYGYYMMNVPSGRYRVSAYADGYLNTGTDNFEIDEYETIQIDLSLEPRPEETSVVCGYIKDFDTEDPIEGATVDLTWYQNEWQYYRNETTSDEYGFYSMNVAGGYVDLDFEAPGYFRNNDNYFYINEYVTEWRNITLKPKPAENAVFCGYLTDEASGDPLSNVNIEIYWVDVEEGFEYENETDTDPNGFFSINVADGEVYHDIRAMGYDYYNPYRLDIEEYEKLWMNFSLERSVIEVEIAKPLNAFYLNNERIMPFPKPRIFGSIDIEAYIPGSWHEPGYAEKVEFYIDDKLKATITEKPYNWTWDKISIGKHTIKIIAYDEDGTFATAEREVRKLL